MFNNSDFMLKIINTLTVKSLDCFLLNNNNNNNNYYYYYYYYYYKEINGNHSLNFLKKKSANLTIYYGQQN